MVIWSDKIDCKCLHSKRNEQCHRPEEKAFAQRKEDSSKGKRPQADEHTERQKWTTNVCAQTRMRHYRPKGAFTRKGSSWKSHQNDDQQKTMSRPSTPLLSTLSDTTSWEKPLLRRRNPLEEVMKPMAIQEQAKKWSLVRVWDKTKQYYWLKRKPCLGRND